MKPKAYKIYMDACCLCRPFDSRDQERVRNEAETILVITHCSSLNDWIIFASEILDIEFFKPYYSNKLKILELYTTITNQYVALTASAMEQSASLWKKDMNAYDSLHVALA